MRPANARGGLAAREPAGQRLGVAAALLAVTIVVSLIGVLSGGALDALIGLPIVAVICVLLFPRGSGIEAFFDWAASRRRPRPRRALRPGFGAELGHSPALRRLLAGSRLLRGPPAVLAA